MTAATLKWYCFSVNEVKMGLPALIPQDRCCGLGRTKVDGGILVLDGRWPMAEPRVGLEGNQMATSERVPARILRRSQARASEHMTQPFQAHLVDERLEMLGSRWG
jgi:hypothetical protein